jgi:hypothetical protein
MVTLEGEKTERKKMETFSAIEWWDFIDSLLKACKPMNDLTGFVDISKLFDWQNRDLLVEGYVPKTLIHQAINSMIQTTKRVSPPDVWKMRCFNVLNDVSYTVMEGGISSVIEDKLLLTQDGDWLKWHAEYARENMVNFGETEEIWGTRVAANVFNMTLLSREEFEKILAKKMPKTGRIIATSLKRLVEENIVNATDQNERRVEEIVEKFSAVMERVA